MSQKILFVAMQNSIHTVRWIKQITNTNLDVHIFPINHYAMHDEICDITIHRPIITIHIITILKNFFKNPGKTFKSLKFCKEKYHNNNKKIKLSFIYPIIIPGIIIRILGKYLKGQKLGESLTRAAPFYSPKTLAKLIKKLQPDIVHSLEFQHCGYLVLAAKERLAKNKFPTWIATNWGSDIYHFQQFPEHKKLIKRLLENIDYYACECTRDIKIAQQLSYIGKVLPVMPNTGGFNIDQIKQLRELIPISKRKIIMVKGYQSFAGRALIALDAIENCRQELASFKIMIFSTSVEIIARINELNQYPELDITTISPHITHLEMLNFYSQARVYLGVSISDGISTSLLESMALGAFPIQTNTSCCDEWIRHDESGFEISHNNLPDIIKCLKEALTNDNLVNNAAIINWETVCSRLNENMLKKKALNIYHAALQED